MLHEFDLCCLVSCFMSGSMQTRCHTTYTHIDIEYNIVLYCIVNGFTCDEFDVVNSMQKHHNQMLKKYLVFHAMAPFQSNPIQSLFAPIHVSYHFLFYFFGFVSGSLQSVSLWILPMAQTIESCRKDVNRCIKGT